MRGDVVPALTPFAERCFNPRPAFSCGATRHHRAIGIAVRGFNPRPAFSCGATARNCHGRGGRWVSIRAPHSHAGRHPRWSHEMLYLRFQSAPRILMRGDIPLRISVYHEIKFQSAPRILMRGDSALPARQYNLARATVSIRAPHSHAGRPPSGIQHMAITVFQSAPRILMRGDHSRRTSASRCASFNPRPAFSCGATMVDCAWKPLALFQSAPRILMRGDPLWARITKG